MNKVILVLIFMSFQQNLFARVSGGGGTVVGNGAGSAENFFQHAYQSLPNLLTGCLHSARCVSIDEDKEIMNQVLSIAKANQNKSDRLLFLSEKKNPGFFNTGVNESHRIAKTFLNPDAPIYINLDLIYDQNNRNLLSYSEMIRILFHEIGHQTGIENHAQLDILSSKLSLFSDSKTDVYRYKIDNEEKDVISFSVINFEMPSKFSQINFNWKNAESINLTKKINPALSCRYDSESFSGLELTNGHYFLDQNGNLAFKMWIIISCYESFSGTILNYRSNLVVSLDADYKIMNFIIE